jgi:hypothetical protein
MKSLYEYLINEKLMDPTPESREMSIEFIKQIHDYVINELPKAFQKFNPGKLVIQSKNEKLPNNEAVIPYDGNTKKFIESVIKNYIRLLPTKLNNHIGMFDCFDPSKPFNKLRNQFPCMGKVYESELQIEPLWNEWFSGLDPQTQSEIEELINPWDEWDQNNIYQFVMWDIIEPMFGDRDLKLKSDYGVLTLNDLRVTMYPIEDYRTPGNICIVFNYKYRPSKN